ncbi:hypothetical protein FIV42_27185 [Persicimonas caeni]|uniref:Outer membrane protein beta-barrel domain-containing protein n=1 Tax=Persicimonas caeni TaxID=2292766 RepID=A0A4Y6Q143_PERCE|nr:hypothetical protein [Persicimonas caeni]QDG54296.1 hypothetical protein FIV42_27185 [Persicimonas caeni]QED35517.1 hypothetical protein FRD00_27180 [Persicimonas caeni]
MKAKHMLASLIAIAALLLGSSAMAQDAPQAPKNALKAGESALAFQFPFGGNPYVSSDSSGLGGLLGLSNGGVLGYHYMLTDNIRGGLNLGLDVVGTTTEVAGETQDATSFGLTLAPQINYYTRTRGTVAPYFFGLINFSTFSDGIDETTGDIDEANDNADRTFNPREQTTASLAAGIGAEWFPVTRVSFSGQVGLNVGLLGATQVADGGAVVEPNFGLNLFTSSIAANIYF